MSGKVQNPDRVLGLHLYEAGKTGERDSGWIAVSYDHDGDYYWVQFEHPKFNPWDMKLNDLEIVIDLVRGKEYLREK